MARKSKTRSGSHVDFQINDTFIESVTDNAKRGVDRLAEDIARDAERRFLARFGSEAELATVKMPTGVKIGYTLNNMGHAYVETGNQYWAGSPCLLPALGEGLRDHFNSKPQ